MMSYVEVMNAIREMAVNGFSYVEYLNLVFKNPLTATMYVLSTTSFISLIMLVTFEITGAVMALKEF